MAVFCLNDELPFVDLLLDNIVGIKTESFPDDDPRRLRPDGAAAVEADHDDVVQVDLAALGHLVDRLDIAALQDGGDPHSRIGSKETSPHLFGEEQGAAVERTGNPPYLGRVRDQGRHRVVDIRSFPDRKDSVDHTTLEGVAQQSSDRPACLRFFPEALVRRPRIE